jgi:DNA-binding XRE family transcriptional regulator
MREKLEHFRSELRLSQERLAGLIGLSGASIRRFEDGANVSPEILEKLKALALERKRPDLAIALSSDEWPVQQILDADETPIFQGKKKMPKGARDLGSELHSLLDDILQSPNAEAVDLAETTLRFCARAVAGQRRRRA